MISQIPGEEEDLEQLVCDGKTMWGSAVESEDGNHRFVAQVTVYARALGIALAQNFSQAWTMGLDDLQENPSPRETLL